MLLLAGCVFTHPEVPDGDSAAPGCIDEGDHVRCAHRTLVFRAGLSAREVHFQVPAGAAPAAGWPVVVLFHGSTQSAAYAWDADATMPFGALAQARLVAALLDTGFAVLTPEARWDGTTWWQTNTFPASLAWEGCEDDRLMEALFAAIADGSFGALDRDRLYATGISSGGYMSSRMALSYPGKFRALAVQSASWATCAGALCALPSALPTDHPPTLFLHGTADVVVPIGTMRAYAEALGNGGIGVDTVEDAGAGHAWSEEAPALVPAWFLDHP